MGSDQPSGSKKRKVLAKSSKAKGKSKAVEPGDQDDFGDEEPVNVLPEVKDISCQTMKLLHKNFSMNMYPTMDPSTWTLATTMMIAP